MVCIARNAERRSRMADEVMTVKELARYLKINEKTIYKLLKNGNVPASKIGGTWRFKKSIIEEWLEKKHKESEQTK